jgi:hypothetical protein
MRRSNEAVKASRALSHRLLSAPWIIGALAALAAHCAAGEAPRPPQKEADDTEADINVSYETEYRFSLVGDSTFKARSDYSTGNAYDWQFRSVASFKVREGFLLRFGLELSRFNFKVPDATPLPSKLQQASLVIGGDFQLGDAWIARVEAEPGFYSGGTRLRDRNFSCPVTLGASYFVSSDLQLVAGLSIDPERKYPVLPGIGFRWKCSRDWVMDFILPAPRIEYALSKSFTLYAGGEVLDGSYRTASDFGSTHDNPSLNNAIVDYTQIRIGGGASWKIATDWALEFEAGVVPVQEFDFHRADFKVRSTEIPPYGAIVLKATF